jgi:hypothetical protein
MAARLDVTRAEEAASATDTLAGEAIEPPRISEVKDV